MARIIRKIVVARREARRGAGKPAALHRQIAQSAGNQLFLSIFDVVNRIRQDEVWQSIRERARRVGKNARASYLQHHAIVDAIAERDPGKAGEAMRQHLLMHQARLIRATSLDEAGMTDADIAALEALDDEGGQLSAAS